MILLHRDDLHIDGNMVDKLTSIQNPYNVEINIVYSSLKEEVFWPAAHLKNFSRPVKIAGQMKLK